VVRLTGQPAAGSWSTAGRTSPWLPARTRPSSLASPDPQALRRWLPPDFLIGVSAHSAVEARRAAASGADYVLLGPVFETESKRGMGAPWD